MRLDLDPAVLQSGFHEPAQGRFRPFQAECRIHLGGTGAVGVADNGQFRGRISLQFLENARELVLRFQCQFVGAELEIHMKRLRAQRRNAQNRTPFLGDFRLGYDSRLLWLGFLTGNANHLIRFISDLRAGLVAYLDSAGASILIWQQYDSGPWSSAGTQKCQKQNGKTDSMLENLKFI